MNKPTRKEKRILKEIEELRSISYGYNYGLCDPILTSERNEIIRNRIITDCTMLEEAMSIIIMNYILADSMTWEEAKYFRRIKRFLMLSDDILSRVSPYTKLEIINKILSKSKRWKKIKGLIPSFFH